MRTLLLGAWLWSAILTTLAGLGWALHRWVPDWLHAMHQTAGPPLRLWAEDVAVLLLQLGLFAIAAFFVGGALWVCGDGLGGWFDSLDSTPPEGTEAAP